ncbi:MAG: hypothetical protein AB7O78_01325 [Thermoleophilia bacterium]
MRPRPNRFTTLTCAAVIAAIGIAGAAGCGGDDDSAALSRDEFVTQANAICAAGNATIAAAVPKDGPPGPAFYETIVETTQGTVDGVAALVPPDEMKADVDAMIADARQALSDMRATPAAEFFASGEDPFASVNQQAGTLGLTDCAGEEG